MDIGIIGGSGYTGGELMRLLSQHPEANIKAVTSRSKKGQKISDTHAHLRKIVDLEFEDLTPVEVASRCDIVFTAVPHGTAMQVVPALIKAGIKVVDLSADYRLKTDVFEKTYKLKHTDPREAVYGIPELHPEVSSQQFIANPGCYPTGASLAVAPLASAGLIERVVFDSKSGISGAGVEPSAVSHYPNMAENIQAYKLTTHRHRAEIVQELTRLDGSLKSISFTPHVIPSVRGILTTAHIFVKKQLSQEDVSAIYNDFYNDKPFIRLIKGIPMLGNVRGSNFCDIGFEVEKGSDRIVAISAIDNLVKGASGQAIQNMNLMSGLPETTGLWSPGFAP
ncbi:MAG: N-acetyl-gamma-glutamyl-phosphate reductase [Candidatus Methanoperedens nitroreducens]|uniref:N-acetyl-gamma-glutamyl-phosphate reductase n=1 Tax=Candidatus Methanoperedens nitratireducens TaxID=1392998 RepID=A0A0P8AAJ0_9EURY|nr:N-acetyl-gamma-glutamyl-phosphate reductase [Candidatus Methanoperedens sp. BLZ2]KAB2948441.1 MAG: N-acetyl-gamma-glutamyl-phosphate reductase [Candidatus Methanoperedens sp.]KPQ43631.1 MAG: N-acetyl-gamma-glutamyl-phosphate reductase [Candidatus Methanoperedens sp. BLZ1]MBZ0174466.1 N-acetyl-gamma-glutamyl-phosphate reductase [Candidatus Methanoperedens nitroreducens]MCX9078488.1 N-acetyl-gamma-glutamyl-phosphate reductase [Candidatus Methanoperedens sp.]